MARLGMESWGYVEDGNHDTASTGFAGRWTMSAGNWDIVDLGDGRKKISSQYYTTSRMVKILSAATTTLISGFYLHRNLSVGRELAFLRNASGTAGIISINGSGQILYQRGVNYATATTLLTSTAAIAIGAPTQVTVKVVLHNTAGAVYIYVGGVLDSSVTGVDTLYQGSDCTEFWLDNPRGVGGTPNHEWSDLYWDDSDVLGDVKCSYEPMDESGSDADWTPTGDTNNEDCVDEVGPDDDTTYNRSTTNGDRDSLGHSGLGNVATAISVEVLVRARKEDANNSSIKVGVKHGANETLSGEKALSTAYAYVSEIFDDVPGGSGWTAAQLAAAESLYQNVST